MRDLHLNRRGSGLAGVGSYRAHATLAKRAEGGRKAINSDLSEWHDSSLEGLPDGFALFCFTEGKG